MPHRLLTLLATVVLITFSPAPAWAYVSPATGKSSPGRVLVPASIPERNWLPGHRGVDLSLGVGAPVVAAGAGRVSFAGMVAGTPSVSVEHPDGIKTTYTPVHARVAKDDEVDEGQIIGTLAGAYAGHAGLHWGALTGPDAYISPLSLLDEPVIRLKPVDALG